MSDSPAVSVIALVTQRLVGLGYRCVAPGILTHDIFCGWKSWISISGRGSFVTVAIGCFNISLQVKILNAMKAAYMASDAALAAWSVGLPLFVVPLGTAIKEGRSFVKTWEAFDDTDICDVVAELVYRITKDSNEYLLSMLDYGKIVGELNFDDLNDLQKHTTPAMLLALGRTDEVGHCVKSVLDQYSGLPGSRGAASPATIYVKFIDNLSLEFADSNT
jgi:hypothetical protein